MNQKINLITLCAVSVLLLGVPNVHAQFWGGNGFNESNMKERKEKRFKEVMEQLSLSQDQKALLEENKKKHAAVSEQLRASTKLIMQSIGEELKKKYLDMARIKDYRAQLRGLRILLEDDRFNGILEVRNILTQEQFAQFVELIEKSKAKKSEE